MAHLPPTATAEIQSIVPMRARSHTMGVATNASLAARGVQPTMAQEEQASEQRFLFPAGRIWLVQWRCPRARLP